MPVTDVHSHLMSAEMIEAIAATGTSASPSFYATEEGVFLRMGGRAPFGPHPESIARADVRVEDLRRQGVDLQLLAVPPLLFGYKQPAEIGAAVSRAINDGLLNAARPYPDRLQVLGDLPMADPASAVSEVARLTLEPLVRGVQIGAHIAEWHLDELRFEPVWQAIEEAKFAVLVHPYAMAADGLPRRYHMGNIVGNPTESTVGLAALIFGGVLRRHPGIPFISVHGGGFVPYQIGRWDHAWQRRPELREHIDELPSRYLSRMYLDTVTHDRLSLELLGRRVGWDHVVVGSDHPFDMAEDDPIGRVRSLGLSEVDEAKVLAGNVETVLRPLPTDNK